MRLIVVAILLVAGSAISGAANAEQERAQVLRAAQFDRGAIRAGRDLATDTVGVTDNLEPPPPPDTCGTVTYQLVPAEVDVIDVEVLQKAEETLDVALRVLRLELPESESTIEDDILFKSMLLSKLMLRICRESGCSLESGDE